MILHDLATFVDNTEFDDLSEHAVGQLQIRLLDSLGTAIGALEGAPVRALRVTRTGALSNWKGLAYPHTVFGEAHQIEKSDYEGFHTRPMSWETVTQKFEALAEPHTSSTLREQIKETVKNFEKNKVTDLMRLLKNVKTGH
ncbi:MAG TPA: hypothetical protein VKA08_08610 [Balneolales bacterium]|nr:hypothetical protein [Balneolales bacterium]